MDLTPTRGPSPALMLSIAVSLLVGACAESVEQGAPSGAGGAGGNGPAPMQPCDMPVAAVPIVLGSVAEQQIEGPSLAVLDHGASALPASVALQMLVSGGANGQAEVRAAAFEVGEAWQAPPVLDRPWIAVGDEARSWARMTPSTDGDALGVAWNTALGGPSRPAFRRLDVATWSPGPVVDIAAQGGSVVALAAGEATGPMGVGWAGEGYAVVWRADVQTPGGVLTAPVAAVVDEAGSRMIGPHPLSPPLDYPRTPAAVWTGSTYLMATGFRDCPSADELCAPQSVVVSRVRPASSGAFDDSGVEAVTLIAALEPGTAPRHQALAVRGDVVWAAWFEGDPNVVPTPSTLRLLRLSPVGAQLSAPVTVATGVVHTTPVRLEATDLGLVLTWAEEGDASLPPESSGRSRVRVLVLDDDGIALTPPMTIDATLVSTQGYASSVALAWPKSLVVSWAGTSPTSPGDVVAWGARLDCAP